MEQFLEWEIYRHDDKTPTVLAKITWNALDDKRKAKMIRGFEFSLPVDFKGYDNKGITWSVVLKVLEPAKEDSHEVLMQMKFLFETAPQYILHYGRKFAFFDGKASGEVIDQTITPLTIDININEYAVECSLFNQWRVIDTITNLDIVLKSRTIYGIIGNLGDGGWALSSLLSGRSSNELEESKLVSVKINGVAATHQLIKDIACYIGEGVAEAPYIARKSYPNKIMKKLLGVKTVAQRIQEGINKSNSQYSLSEISSMFDLTGLEEKDESNGRIHRSLEFQGSEVWRASMAIGFAYGKILYCCPWMQGELYSNYIIGDYNRKYIEILKAHNAIVLIPVPQKEELINIADEFIYLNNDLKGGTQ